jgi:hypothetical protein
MTERFLFDIYRRYKVTAEQTTDGVWVLYILGSDGKRSRLTDVIVPDHATLDEVERQLEAVFHEIGTPDTSIVRIDT